MRTNSDTVGTYSLAPDLIHGALGLADELIELRTALDKCDRVNALEESSDVCWFTALIAHAINDDPFQYVDSIGDFDPFDNLEYFIGEVVSMVKRAYAYGKPINEEDLSLALCCIIDSINALAIKLDSTLDDVLELNVAKLSTRYPERFTPEQANNRNTERERKTLEQSAG